MALYAVAAVEDALDATKSFLLPVDVRQWAKLALVVLFVGGGGGFNVPSGGGSPGSGTEGSTGTPPWEGVASGTMELLLIAAIVLVAVVVLFALAVLVVGPIMEYVLLESLRTRDVTIRSFWSEHWPAGLRLLAFRLGLLIGTLALFLPIVALGFLGTPAIFLLAIPLGLVVVPSFVLVNGFTTLFVVPITIVEDCGLIEGWRQLLRTQPKETAAFVGGFALVTIALGIVVGIVVLFATLALLVPFAILGLLAYVAGGSTFSLPVIVVLAILAVIFVVFYLAATAIVQVPMVVYKRYYALLVLGDLSTRFDLIPGLRGTIRAAETEE
jgi:hypothetical protein